MDGALQEVGLPINPLLAVAGYSAQWELYRGRLADNRTRPTLSVSLLSSATTPASATVTLPPPAVAAQYGAIGLDVNLTCGGATDLSCDQWDHVLSVTANCATAGLAEGEPGALPFLCFHFVHSSICMVEPRLLCRRQRD